MTFPRIPSTAASRKKPAWLMLVVAVTFGAALSACGATQDTATVVEPPVPVDTTAAQQARSNDGKPAVTQSEQATQAVNPDLGSAIRQDMSYSELRTAMAGQGWQPVGGDTCLVNMVGAGHAAKCAAKPDSQSCAWCRDLPGLQQCSADGHCLLRFREASSGKLLEVGMDGELDLWKNNAPDTMFGVSGWRYPAHDVP
jgi:hypothetical protein